VAAPAAVLGLVNPFLAAIAMSGSSLIVTVNALRMNIAPRRPSAPGPVRPPVRAAAVAGNAS
jgi:Cu2+-exporting ATPase